MKIAFVNIGKGRYDQLLNTYLQDLYSDEIRKIQTFKRMEDRVRSCIGKVLINKLIFPYEDAICYDTYGKPYMKEKALHFNISHSGEWVVGVLGREPVGIDIEQIIDIDYEGICAKCFHLEEQQYITKTKQNTLDAFYTIWTLKESYLKMVGIGLNDQMNQFSVVGKDSIKKEMKCEITGKNVYFYTQKIKNEYRLAICSIKEIEGEIK